MDKMICDFCGATQDKVFFAIGSSTKPDWCLHEATGRVTCPQCYDIGKWEAQEVIDSLRQNQ